MPTSKATTRIRSDDAFNYNKGLPVKKHLTGETVQRKTPYDWTVVTERSTWACSIG